MHRKVTRPLGEAALENPPVHARPFLRLLSSIRWDEVLVLQGAPLIGACFTLRALTINNLLALAVFGFASCCLVAHVFALNDWSGIDGDLRDPKRAAQTFFAKGVNRFAFGMFAMGLLAPSLLIFAIIGKSTLILAVAIAGLGALYSVRLFNVKGKPVFNSLLHLVGGMLHFLLGYAMWAVLDVRAVAIGCFFGLVFTAGHINHETRDYEADLVNGIRTNAVAYGKAPAFVAGLVLFTIAYALLAALALCGVLPRILVAAAMLYPLHLYASLQALRGGLEFESLRRLQMGYRLLYAMIGIVMVAANWLDRTI
ncbi:UbiA family prenyltransferase [uncultured Bradyrhizobium sp.]|uniref:UbiA family prenyltransferase n=1 Tax=uncultured Bradyrhizobium sp. TaxID=199684 RepID=UPI0035C9F6FA